MNLKKLFILAFVSVFSGCAVYAGLNFDELFGKQQVRDRQALFCRLKHSTSLMK